MKNLVVLVVAVTATVLATSVLSGNAGVNKAVQAQASTASLQAQVNELRSELICLATISGDGVAADGFWAAEASGTPKAETAINDRGVCKRLKVITQGTSPVPNSMIPPFNELVRRAFGG